MKKHLKICTGKEGFNTRAPFAEGCGRFSVCQPEKVLLIFSEKCFALENYFYTHQKPCEFRIGFTLVTALLLQPKS